MAVSTLFFIALLLLLSLPLPTTATCTITTHNPTANALLLRGTVLLSRGATPHTYILVSHADSTISYVGPSNPMRWFPGFISHVIATEVECDDDDDTVISPGFVNTHEHVEFSTVEPLKWTGELNEHRHDWRRGLRNHTLRAVGVNGSVADAVTWGELRHLFSGTTSIVGGKMVPGLVRNLDFVSGLGPGLDAPAATWDVFPLDDAAGLLSRDDCDYGPEPIDRETAGKAHRYLAHIGEGIDDWARNEFACLSDTTSTDIVAPNLALVHALALSPAAFDLVAARRAMVVWSPRSNVFLYGKTLDVAYLAHARITVALGTDWLPSGSATMQREATCATAVTLQSYNVELAPHDVWEMMTINAARVAGFEQSLGSIAVGKVADIVVFGRGPGVQMADPFARAVYADTRDIELVLRGGKAMVAAESLQELAEGRCEMVMFGDAQKTVCVEDDMGVSYSELEQRLGGVYPAVLAGVPRDEPSCVASR
ncbi:metal dependent amidohydrolase [Pleomassaria siparia CBS 279.74]|uniref:Metal dependent amidohydrolase n=1 Tax=Pleomassaria siparia CBS 279.74 TaxID=1314801 RepID=A0A6G1JTK6_9PLEO|nr:metal dependent amidohydrolase [Pleomassaria siparia CBS 279.74]